MRHRYLDWPSIQSVQLWNVPKKKRNDSENMEESLDKFKERPRQKILINLDFEGNVHSDNFIQSFHLSEGMYMEKLMIAMIRVWLEKA